MPGLRAARSGDPEAHFERGNAEMPVRERVEEPGEAFVWIQSQRKAR